MIFSILYYLIHFHLSFFINLGSSLLHPSSLLYNLHPFLLFPCYSIELNPTFLYPSIHLFIFLHPIFYSTSLSPIILMFYHNPPSSFYYSHTPCHHHYPQFFPLFSSSLLSLKFPYAPLRSLILPSFHIPSFKSYLFLLNPVQPSQSILAFTQYLHINMTVVLHILH